MRHPAASALHDEGEHSIRAGPQENVPRSRSSWGFAGGSEVWMMSRESGRIPLRLCLQVTQPLLDIDVDALEAPRQVAGVELLHADLFEVVGADGVRENRKQELDSQLRGLEAMGVVQRAVQ